jgi:hypothetical protein
MLETSVEKEILNEIHRMKTEQQVKVLEFVRSLAKSSGKAIPGKNLLRFSGKITKNDLQKMTLAIDAECERIDRDEW